MLPWTPSSQSGALALPVSTLAFFWQRNFPKSSHAKNYQTKFPLERGNPPSLHKTEKKGRKAPLSPVTSSLSCIPKPF